MKRLALISVAIIVLTNILYSQDIINETGKDGKFIVRDSEQQEFLIIKDGNVEILGTLSIDSLAQGTVGDRQVVWSNEDKQFKALYNLIPRSTINASIMAADSWTESGSDVYRASGNVGIGVATPIYPLTVYRSGANASVVTQRDGGAINYINATATHGTFGTVNNFPTRIAQNAQIKIFLDKDNNGLYFGSIGNVTSSTDDDIDVAIDSDGNVGIGTTNPTSKLQVDGNFYINKDKGAGIIFGPGDDEVTMAFKDPSGGYGQISFKRAETKINGYLGVGSLLSSPTHNFHAEGSAYTDFIAKIVNRSNELTSDGLRIRIGPNSNPGVNNDYIQFRDGDGGIIGYICGDGSGGVNFTSVSDKKLKMNIIDYDQALDKVSRIKVREYEMKSAPGKKQVGLIAQELVEVYPQIVSGPFDKIENDKPMGIDYGKLTPLLVKAIQEQQTTIEELTKRIEYLETN